MKSGSTRWKRTPSYNPSPASFLKFSTVFGASSSKSSSSIAPWFVSIVALLMAATLSTDARQPRGERLALGVVPARGQRPPGGRLGGAERVVHDRLARLREHDEREPCV